MALSINQLKKGVTISIDKDVFIIADVQHVKPGKGAAFVRTKLKNLKTDTLLEKTFKGDEKIDEAFVQDRKMQYLYNSHDIYHFLDLETYEDLTIDKEFLHDKIQLLKENLQVSGLFYNEHLLNITLPNFIDFKIIYTEPGLKGDTAKGGSKPAKIETGATIQVPLFINIGDIIRVDARTNSYAGRI